MRRFPGFIGAVVIIATLSFTPMAVLAAGLTYEGSSTIGENVMPELAKAFEAKEKIKFTSIGLLGSGKGFKAVMEGKADIGGVSRPLSTEEKKEVTRRMASGDLTCDISGEAGRDEIGQLTEDMRKMVCSFEGIISGILTSSNKVVTTVDMLKARTEKTAQGAQTQSGQASQIATAVDEQSAASEEVARNIERTSNIAHEMEGMSGEMMLEVNTLAGVASELRSSTSGFKTKG